MIKKRKLFFNLGFVDLNRVMDADQILAITFISMLAICILVCVGYITTASCKEKSQDRLLEV